MRSGPEPAAAEQLRPRPDTGSGRSLFISGLGVGQICSWGSIYYGFPLIAEAMETDVGWSRLSLYGAATLGLVLAALLSFPVGRAVDKGHGRLVMAMGSAIAGMLFMAWSQVGDVPGFYLAVVLLGATQAATLYEPAFAVIARRYGAARARPGLTALKLWGGFASTVFIPLIQVLMDAQGWRGALMTLGAVNLLCAGLYWSVIDPKKDVAQPPPANPADAPHDARPIRFALRSPVFWLLMLAFAAHASAFTAFTFHMYPMLLEFGFGTAAIVAALAIIGPAQVGGRIAVTLLASRASIRHVGAVTVLGFPIAFAALAFLPPTFLLVAGVTLLYGAANGVLTIVRGAAVPEMLTQRSYGAINGVMNAPATMARAFAPLAAAALWTAGQSYQPVILAILAGSFVLAFGFWSAAWLSRRPAPSPVVTSQS